MDQPTRVIPTERAVAALDRYDYRALLVVPGSVKVRGRRVAIVAEIWPWDDHNAELGLRPQVRGALGRRAAALDAEARRILAYLATISNIAPGTSRRRPCARFT